jgi:hypothetical protein
LDVKIVNCSKFKFPGYHIRATFLDIKALIDPETIVARGNPYQSFETQIDNILKSIISQRNRAKQYKESVIHIINFLRIRPSDRVYCMKIFAAKAARDKLDLNGVQFLNTYDSSISMFLQWQIIL